jgi:GxxExxY protein
MDIEEIAAIAVDCGFRTHKGLGRGLLESAYQAVFTELLRRQGLFIEEEKIIPIIFDDIIIDKGFRADVIVEGKLLIELKSIERLLPVRGKQVLTYLRLANLPLGLLMNFGSELFKDGIRRIANGYDDKDATRLHIHQAQTPSRT